MVPARPCRAGARTRTPAGCTGAGRAPTCSRCRRGSGCRPWRSGWRPRPAAALATCAARCAVGVVGVDAHRRVVHRAPRSLDGRASSRRACAGSPGSCRSARRTARAPWRTRWSRASNHRAVPSISAASATVARCEPAARRRPAARTPASPGGTSTSKMRRVESSEPTWRRRARRASHDRDAAVADDDEHVVDAVGFEHERLRRLVVGDPVAVRARDATVAARRPRSRRRPRRAGRASERQRQRGRGEERTGREHRAALLEEQAEVDQRPVAEHDPLAQLLPQRIGRGRVVDVRAHERRSGTASASSARAVSRTSTCSSREGEVHALSPAAVRGRGWR